MKAQFRFAIFRERDNKHDQSLSGQQISIWYAIFDRAN